MAIVSTKEFVIAVQNEPGAFADITTALAAKNVNISGFLAEGRGEFGVLRLVTDNPEAAESALRDGQQTFRINDVLSVRVPNNPGQLARIAQLLAASGVNVNAAYTTAGKGGDTLLTFVLDDRRSAEKVLTQL